MKDFDAREHHLLATTTGNFTFQKVTQRLLYAQLIRLQYRDHHSSAKLVEKLRNPVDWDNVWTSVHKPPLHGGDHLFHMGTDTLEYVHYALL